MLGKGSVCDLTVPSTAAVSGNPRLEAYLDPDKLPSYSAPQYYAEENLNEIPFKQNANLYFGNIHRLTRHASLAN